MRTLALCLALSVAPVSALADSGAPVPVLVDAGVDAAPSSQLHDPTTDPGGAVADLRAAATHDKVRWPLLVLTVLIGLSKVLPFLGGKLAPIGRWLSVGRRAVTVAGIGGLAAVAYDSLSKGSTWGSAAVTLGAALFALVSPTAPPTAVAKAAETAPVAEPKVTVL